ncbi:tyrosine kinase domain protein, partial [Rhizoctonia solani AG-3 Rhs1AP]
MLLDPKLNILVDHHCRPKLADFGSALLEEYLSLRFTGNSRKPGLTLRWAAPELIANETGPSKPADVYALGMTILEIFTRSVPFADVKRDIALCHIVAFQKKHPTRPEALHLDKFKDDRLWSLLVGSWAYEPQDRPLAIEVYEKVWSLHLLSTERSLRHL